jgi:hypothetical protein
MPYKNLAWRRLGTLPTPLPEGCEVGGNNVVSEKYASQLAGGNSIPLGLVSSLRMSAGTPGK